MVAVVDHDGDLTAVRDTVAARIDALHEGRAAEAVWSHIVDLIHRVDAAELCADDLATAERVADKRLVGRAHQKLTAREHDHCAYTPAMLATPRRRLGERARFGSWDQFPVSPARYYDRLGGGAATWVGKGASFEACRRLQARRDRLDTSRRTPAERLALSRAFHIVAWELQERGDDSYGTIGQLRADAWRSYLAADPVPAGMDPALWWADLAEMLVWEDYGLTYGIETLHWERLPGVLADDTDDVLVHLADELAALHLRYQAHQAIEQVAWLAVVHHRTHRFVPLATRLGADGWIVVERLAQCALQRDDAALADAVFTAADQPGTLRDNLHRAAERTLRRPWQPPLRLVVANEPQLARDDRT